MYTSIHVHDPLLLLDFRQTFKFSQHILNWSEVKCSAVKGVKSGCTVKGIYGWWKEVSWRAVKCSVVQWWGLNRGVPWRVFMVGEMKWSELKCSEVNCSAVQWRGLNRGVPSRVFMVGEVKWVKCSEVKCSAVKGVKSRCTVKGIYGWWSEVSWSAVKWTVVQCSEGG